jgi:restriction endonuclease Mrr
MSDLEYYANENLSPCPNEGTPFILRYEKCAEQILLIVNEGPKTKAEIRSELINRFGTELTETRRDDEKLYAYIGQILRSLTEKEIIRFENGYYSISEPMIASIDDITAKANLCADFLNRIHSKGGDFFEKYLLSLVVKELESDGKHVSNATVTGGSLDGGIDGIIDITDELGFREKIMLQMKNRNSNTSETEVRAFYGAMCAQGGTRGIYAITADFHDSAKAFIISVDNLVGINGKDIFNMACSCKYGIVEINGILEIDRSIL